MTINQKHEPVSEDVEREAFEAWFSAMEWSRETHYRKYDDGEYIDTEVAFAWRVWQARAAAVKPPENIVTVNMPTCKTCGNIDWRASTGNTEERTPFDADALAKRIAAWTASPEGKAELEACAERIRQTGIDAEQARRIDPRLLLEPIRVASPSSPLSEEKAFQLVDAICNAAGDLYKELLPYTEGNRGNVNEAYMAILLDKIELLKLLPHLSDTSAEKARVEGLVNYVVHYPSCAWLVTHSPDTKCDCGLCEALAAF